MPGVRDSASAAEFRRLIGRSAESRWARRVIAVHMVGKGVPHMRVAELVEISEPTLDKWLRRNRAEGYEALGDRKPTGRPRRLSDSQLKEIAAVVRRSPARAGLTAATWTSKVLAAWIEQRYGVRLSVRQAQRLLKSITGAFL
jgi:transposase